MTNEHGTFFSSEASNDLESTLFQTMAEYRQQQAIVWANADKYHCHHMVSLGIMS